MNKIYVVGIGPGAYEKMTIEAANILQESDVIIGYTVYVDLVRAHFPQKEFLTTPMRQEVKRCEIAIEKAKEGKQVAMICSGDAGVYGMAGLLLELAEGEQIEIEVLPGVTAALSGAAVLGAPLMHDFCVISLSDLMTPWEKIEKRLLAAAESDLVICLYNPASKKRNDYLKRACELILQKQPGNTMCGYVKNIGRDGQSVQILTLEELKDAQVDMFTTVFVGNSTTKKIDHHLVTPRGYKIETEGA